MLGRTADNAAIQAEIEDIEIRLQRIARLDTDGVITGLRVRAAGLNLLLEPGRFQLQGVLGVFTETQGLVPDSAAVDSQGFVVIEASQRDTQGVDPYQDPVVVRSDIDFAVKCVSEFDATRQLMLCAYTVVADNQEADGSLVLVQQPFSQTAVITIPGIVYELGLREVAALTVTGPGGIVFTETLNPTAPHTYYCDHEHGWIRFAYADAGSTVTLTGTSGYPVAESHLEIDSTRERFPDNRIVSGYQDARHRNTEARIGTRTNPHATGFNDVQGPIPMQMQLYDTGYGVYPELNREGIPGKLETQVVTAGMRGTQGVFNRDIFGTATGIPGDQYITIPGFPLRIIAVNTITSTGDKTAIPFYRHQDNICFPGTQNFSEVIAGVTDPQPLRVEITYGSIPDFAPGTAIGNQIELFPNTEMVCFSEGREIPWSQVQQRADFSHHIGVPVELEVAVDQNGSPVIEPQYLDAGSVSAGQSGFTTAIKTGAASRLALTVLNSGLETPLKPPLGYLTINPATVTGRRRFVYAYFRAGKQLLSQTQISQATGANRGNYDGARLYRNTVLDQGVFKSGVLVDRGSWYWNRETKNFTVSDEIFKAYPQTAPGFCLVADAVTSARNASGYLEVQGTKIATGVSARAVIQTTGATFRTGDSFTTTLPDGKSVTKTWYALGHGFTGTTVAGIAQSIVDGFHANPLCAAYLGSSKLVITATGDTVTFSVPASGATDDLNISLQSPGNQFVLTVATGSGIPVGSVYHAELKVLETPLASTITLSPDKTSGAVTLSYWEPNTGFTSLIQNVLSGAAIAFNQDPAVDAAGISAAFTVNKLVFTAAPGAAGNKLIATADTANNAVSVTTYAGGSDKPASGINALAGTQVEITDGYDYDPNGYFVIYATGDLDDGGSETVYTRVGEVRQSLDISQYQVGLNPANFVPATTGPSSLNTGNEFMLSVLISGTDATGASISETLVLTPQVFCDYMETRNRVVNEFQFVRTKNLYQTLSSWTVTGKQNTGSAKLVVLSEVVSGVRALFPVFRAFWNGTALQDIRDARAFLSTTTVDDNTLLTGEGVETAFNVLQILDSFIS